MKFFQRIIGRFNPAPRLGGWFHPEPTDRGRAATFGGYTPERISVLLAAADSGDIEQLCLCGRDILERNWDIQGALDQRADTLCGVKWDVQPGGPGAADARAAAAFAEALAECGEINGLETFYDWLRHSMDAVVMPFSAAEIVWGDGGKLDGFRALEAWRFTLRDGFEPRLICDGYPSGLPEEEQRDRIIFHRFRKTPDPARSGKIRALAWLHCFQNWPIKDLFSFIERFGMPFVVARVDDNTWKAERDVLHRLIRNFGPSGGGVFTKGTEVQLLNAANTGDNNVYFHALEFTHNAIYTLLTGQLASSGDSSGMSNGSAQTAVRQDILEADARAIESTVRARIAAPWARFNFGENAAAPRLHFQVEPPEDLVRLAGIVANLSTGGFEADPGELSERFGLKLRYRPPAAPSSGMALAAEPRFVRKSFEEVYAEGTKNAEPDKTGLADALETWLGPVADGIAAAAAMPDDELDARLRSGTIAATGDVSALEALLAADMREKFDGNKNKRR